MFSIANVKCSVVAAILACFACAKASPSERSDTGRPRATQQVTVKTDAAADSQFARFLSLSIATRKENRIIVDSVYTQGDIHVGGDVAPCPQDALETRWLADYRVLSVTTNGDSAAATAAITTAATQTDRNGQGFEAVPEIREDTARWLMIREPVTNHKWMVCGDNKRFGLSMNGRTIEWPKGGSAQSVRNTIDSIRRARGLPLLR